MSPFLAHMCRKMEGKEEEKKKRNREKETRYLPSSHILNIESLKCFFPPTSRPPGYQNIFHSVTTMALPVS
jgi:hypothetical protein